MRGADEQQSHIFSYLSPQARVRKDHRLRAIRDMVDEVLAQMSGSFDAMDADVGRPSIAPEKLLRAQLLQMLYSVRSSREEIYISGVKCRCLTRRSNSVGRAGAGGMGRPQLGLPRLRAWAIGIAIGPDHTLPRVTLLVRILARRHEVCGT